MASFLGLCHFCEYHGPTVVMLTQSLRQDRTEGICAGDSCPLFTCDEDVLEPIELTGSCHFTNLDFYSENLAEVYFMFFIIEIRLLILR